MRKDDQLPSDAFQAVSRRVRENGIAEEASIGSGPAYMGSTVESLEGWVEGATVLSDGRTACKDCGGCRVWGSLFT